jgi:hypothetical protein
LWESTLSFCHTRIVRSTEPVTINLVPEAGHV